MNNNCRHLISLALVASLAGTGVNAEAGLASKIVEAVAKRAGSLKKGGDVARKAKPPKSSGKAAKAKANKSRRAERASDLADATQSNQGSAECSQGAAGKRGTGGNC